MKKIVLNPISMLLFGGLFGVLSKYWDINTQNLGNVFSKCTIWILLCVMITLYSPTKRKAMLHVFVFCVSMLVTYYGYAQLMDAVYGMDFVMGWSLVAILSPVMSAVVYRVKKKDVLSLFICFGIILVSIWSSMLLFSFDVFDGILNFILFLVLKKEFV